MPAFQISHHTSPPCISSLTELPAPDLIIISQDKPDHCHRETLCSLPAEISVKILATSAAAKKIRSWKHFKNANIETFVPYDPDKPKTLKRIPISSYSLRSAAGELTVAYMPQKLDFTSLHNAIGITYRAPGTRTMSPSGLIMDLPLSPPESSASSSVRTPATERSALSFADTDSQIQTPPDSPLDGPRMEFMPKDMGREKTLSVLYSPHGVSMKAITSYATSHLVKEQALPLTALFHSINVEDNPWFLGGKVAVGYPGGEEIVKSFGARYWISAHDEVKDNRGWSVAMIKSTNHALEDAQRALDGQLRGQGIPEVYGDKRVVSRTQILSMDSGEQLYIP